VFARFALLIEAEVMVAIPERLAVVGISPKSFGHYFFSGLQSDGVEYLGLNSQLPSQVLGTYHNRCLFMSLQHLAATYDDALGGKKPDSNVYMRMQLQEVLVQLRSGTCSPRELLVRCREFGLSDWTRLALRTHPKTMLAYVRLMRRKVEPGYGFSPIGADLVPLPGVRDMGGFVKWLQCPSPKIVE
jgi:hypothetical protein